MRQLVALFFAAIPFACAAQELHFENVDGKAASHLIGADARLQLLVTRFETNGLQSDQTRNVQYQSSPAGIVSISESGLVTPLADGEVQVEATTDSGVTAKTTLTVSGTTENHPISFPGQVVPIFTKLGCNGGGCHGKIAGQNGFRLSLLGFEPGVDHKHLVAESRGRRVSFSAPDRSLLLQKTTNEVPHGGGARTGRDSHEYRMLRRWIAQGMPYGSGDEPQVTEIRVFPESRRVLAGSEQQLTVLATYSDGRVEDITRGAVFESNDDQMAEVTPEGLVKVGELVGDVSVMARYQGHVCVFRADIPLRLDGGKTLASQQENLVDRYVYQKLESLGIPPSPVCDDATFLRRTTLDIAGRLPTLEETDAFLADQDANKRAALVDRLLGDEDYALHFAKKWSVILRNRRAGGALQLNNMVFHRWLRDAMRSNEPYDQIVRELLTASGTVDSNPPVAWLQNVTDANERVEDISQLFLGQRIQCARCHHHPYEKWSQEDYARLSGFFSTISKKTQTGDLTFVTRIANPSGRHPGNGRTFKPAGLDSDEVVIDATDDPRQALADWMTSTNNPYFAKSLVNRYWKHFLGRGLVEPEDDMRITNPPTNPELLDALAESFSASGYNLHTLIRTLCLSKTYQASSSAEEDNVIDRRSHSRYYPKRLQAETLLDSIDAVAGTKTGFAGMPADTRAIALPDTGFNSYFLTVFGQPDAKTACECERSSEANLAQSLHLLNSDQMNQKLTDNNGRAAKLAADTETPTEEKLSLLYKVALSREPTEREVKASVEILGRQRESTTSLGRFDLGLGELQRVSLQSLMWLRVFFVWLAWSIGCCSTVLAQLPVIQLHSLSRSVFHPAEEAEIQIAGASIDEAAELRFSHPGLSCRSHNGSATPVFYRIRAQVRPLSRACRRRRSSRTLRRSRGRAVWRVESTLRLGAFKGGVRSRDRPRPQLNDGV